MLLQVGYMAPSKQVKESYKDIASQCDAALAKLKRIFDQDIPALNEMIRQKTLPVIGVKKETKEYGKIIY
jgi:hypothetical protein